MLLHDARRDVSPEREAASWTAISRPGPTSTRTAFLADYHALGALNHRGSSASSPAGDPRRQAPLPRLHARASGTTWTVCLTDPALSDLKAWFDQYVPEEARR
jgi:aminoglycoside/choline kinase family phosphotransferase